MEVRAISGYSNELKIKQSFKFSSPASVATFQVFTSHVWLVAADGELSLQEGLSVRRPRATQPRGPAVPGRGRGDVKAVLVHLYHRRQVLSSLALHYQRSGSVTDRWPCPYRREHTGSNGKLCCRTYSGDVKTILERKVQAFLKTLADFLLCFQIRRAAALAPLCRGKTRVRGPSR